MNHFLLVVSLFLIGLGQVEAACPTERVVGNAISRLLSGKTVCVRGDSDWENQEIHDTDGTLSDFKKGPNDPVDPTKVIGSWGRRGNNVLYRYSGGDTFSYEVYYSASTAPAICLVNSTTTVEGTLVAGPGCGDF
ncbi:hypothetical protein [Methylomonas sp. MgM2]